MKCSICETDTKDKMRGLVICKDCRPKVKDKRTEMLTDYKAKEKAFLANPTDTDILGELTLLKRGSITEAIEELTKE